MLPGVPARSRGTSRTPGEHGPQLTPANLGLQGAAMWGDCFAVGGDAGEKPVEAGLEGEPVVVVVQQVGGAAGGEVGETAGAGEVLEVCLGRGRPAGVGCGVAFAVIPAGADMGVTHGVRVHGTPDG